MKVAIFSGGEFSSTKIYPYDLLICADKGFSYAKKLNLMPSVVLGDFDSLEYIPQNATIYNKDKDFSDTHLAVDKAISLGATEIDLYFCLGGRLDHLLFNVNLLKYAKDKGVPTHATATAVATRRWPAWPVRCRADHRGHRAAR